MNSLTRLARPSVLIASLLLVLLGTGTAGCGARRRDEMRLPEVIEAP
jgi:hypothetical protein